MITLYLCTEGILEEPLLYLSLYLKTHREQYYALLQEVREYGRWEAWFEFFLTGITEVATQANNAARQISEIIQRGCGEDRHPWAGRADGENDARSLAEAADPDCRVSSKSREYNIPDGE